MYPQQTMADVSMINQAMLSNILATHMMNRGLYPNPHALSALSAQLPSHHMPGSMSSVVPGAMPAGMPGVMTGGIPGGIPGGVPFTMTGNNMPVPTFFNTAHSRPAQPTSTTSMSESLST